jgi:hypothetical protein
MDEDRSKTSSEFAVSAGADTKEAAQEALGAMRDDFSLQSGALRKVFLGETRFETPKQDQEMAIIIGSYLDRLAFHMHVQSLICARLDGLDTESMTEELERFIDKTKPLEKPPEI